MINVIFTDKRTELTIISHLRENISPEPRLTLFIPQAPKYSKKFALVPAGWAEATRQDDRRLELPVSGRDKSRKTPVWFPPARSSVRIADYRTCERGEY
jgi:hypothetical protein